MSVLSPRTTLIGILCALGGAATLSINDMAIKFLSGAYPLHEVVLARSVIGMTVLLVMMRGSDGHFGAMRTRQLPLHLARMGCVVMSNVMYFLGLAALPLADAVAIVFVSPLLITAFSVLLLGEKVGPRRWAAVAVGLAGVVVMTRPGAGVVQPAALLVLGSAVFYALMQILTRRMAASESAMTMSFYVQLAFIVVSSAMGLAVGDGRFGAQPDASLAFLLRPWVWPQLADIPAFLATGVSVAIGGLLISQAYRLCAAGLVAPFEYVAMPLAIFWGALIFGQWPDLTAWIGIALICGAGLYTFWRETARKRETAIET
ncbi:DMT family transporter [Rhodobacter ferrooxidans]|uniref:EamA domain-containing protein n=1 Tax=Rhodobacter ferrooxidans TaxID=371731 RepID=C8RWJ7_9RHOB|nr:protein of unknown function DUF6 transmembrane [Rhodobacter sp. SW2]